MKSKARIVQDKIDALHKNELLDLQNELLVLQKRCKHVRAVKEYHADAGNWDRDNDIYWVKLYCPTCLKNWEVYSATSAYTKYTEVKSITNWRRENENN